MDDAALERLLFPAADGGANTRAAIDWPAIQRELKRRSVTLALLWQESLPRRLPMRTGSSWKR
jgi:hypothetical protein